MGGPVRLRLYFNQKRRHNPVEQNASEMAYYNTKSTNLYREFFEKLEKLDKDIKFLRDDIDALDTAISQALVKACGGAPGMTVETVLAMDRTPPESLGDLIAHDNRVFFGGDIRLRDQSSRKIGRHLTKLALRPLVPMFRGLRACVDKSAYTIHQTLSELPPGPMVFDKKLQAADIKRYNGEGFFESVLQVAANTLDVLMQQLDAIDEQKDAIASFIGVFKKPNFQGVALRYGWDLKETNEWPWRIFGSTAYLAELYLNQAKTVEREYLYQLKRMDDFARPLDLVDEYEEMLVNWEEWIDARRQYPKRDGD
ncbi:hypothetical protein IWX90DRAFT_412121 [Phyllosticta citrichinensis]|uniref:Uncharacterized protein n=1 Tax=Phyllosticta citrichinensis TaxID=1130410 RepID=A0ABR1Y336_9PEZI